VYYLYPENPAQAARAAERDDHRFFKKFGESMPKGDWNHPGTKQGIYMMGPEAEYLEGKFAASGEPADIRARLQRALARWQSLREEKGYANKPIPTVPWSPPPGVEGELILRVNVRDLPRGPGDKSGARIHEVQSSGLWRDFTKWAWNENWVAIESARSLVPSGNDVEQVNAELVKRICREVMIDNVRGQTSEWSAQEVREAYITMQLLGDGRIEYAGKVKMEAGSRGFDAKLYGQGAWDADKRAFSSLDIVVIGLRSGNTQFNQRESDPGPAPMGVTLSLRRR
jgi:hypothetical protein